MGKVQTPNAPAGRYAKHTFELDLNTSTVACPAGQTTELRSIKNEHFAPFARVCQS